MVVGKTEKGEQVDITEKVTIKQRLEGGERQPCRQLRKGTPGREGGQC